MTEYKRLWRASRPYRGFILLGLFLSFVSVLAELSVPLFTGYAVDAIAKESGVDFPLLFFWILHILCAALLSSVSHHFMHRTTNHAAILAGRDLRAALCRKLEKLTLTDADRLSRGEILNLVTSDIEKITDGMMMAFAELCGGIFAILVTLSVIFALNPHVALTVLVLTPLSVLVARFITAKSRKLFSAQAEARATLSALTEEHFAGQRDILAFGQETRCFSAFSAGSHKLKTIGVKAHFYGAMVNPVTRFVNGLVYAAVAVCGALFAFEGGLAAVTIGELSCLLAYVHQYTTPFNNISAVVSEIELARASAARLFHVLDLPEEPEENAETDAFDCTGALRFHDVSFAYPGTKKPVLSHFSLEVRAGECVAIVGKTGAGKTTLISLLMRFFEPTQGEILLDNQSTAQLSRSAVRRNFGMVLQEPWLFTGTVRENIALGKPEATLEEVRQAAQSAGAASFIERLEHGYDTPLSGDADDDRLSAGQKQLICLARVFLVKPHMLILDEATSSVDTRSEIKIRRAFDKLMEGKTSFVVAHRLSTVQNADKILVMERGAVVESGTHRELLAKRGAYYKLYHSQFLHTDADFDSAPDSCYTDAQSGGSKQ